MLCVICCDETKRLQLQKCCCDVCCGCFLLYIKTQLENINYASKLHCPGECGNTYELSELLQNSEMQNDLNVALLLKYLQTTQDVRPCPSNNCGNFGILPTNQCNDQLMCCSCGTQWDSPELQTSSKRFITSIINYHLVINNLLNSMQNIVFNKTCPQCKIPIYKNGGCYHMTCRQCNYEFCWHCKQEYHNHTKSICRLHFGIKYGIILNMILNLIYAFDIHQFIINKLVTTFYFFSWFSISNVIAIYIIQTGLELKQFYQNDKYMKEYYPKGNLTLHISQKEIYNRVVENMCLITFIVLVLISITNFNFYDWQWFMAQEIGLSFFLLQGYKFYKSYFKQILEGWLQYVR